MWWGSGQVITPPPPPHFSRLPPIFLSLLDSISHTTSQPPLPRTPPASLPDFGGVRAGSAHGSSKRDFGGTQTAIARGVDPHAARRKKPKNLGVASGRKMLDAAVNGLPAPDQLIPLRDGCSPRSISLPKCCLGKYGLIVKYILTFFVVFAHIDMYIDRSIER